MKQPAAAVIRAFRAKIRAHYRSHGRSMVPDDTASLVALPGIGAATAASIRAFAFAAPVVFIETNIRRVFIHDFFPGREAVADAELLPLVAAALATRSPREWYYALMDYGAALARQVLNPKRRSRAYARQSRFEGSDRQLRGAILRALVGAAPLTGSAVARAAGRDRERVLGLLGVLAGEGFVERVGARFRIAS